MMFKRIIHLIIKELLAVLRDPRMRVLLVFPPLVEIVLFSFAITQEVKNVNLAVLNQDVGVSGASLLLQFENTPTFREIIRLRSHNEIDETIDNQKAIAVLVIPQTFSQDLHSQKRAPDLQIILDGRRANAAPIVGGYMQKIIGRFVRLQLAPDSSIHSTSNAVIPGISVITRNWFNPNLNPQSALVPCLICILATIMGLVFSALAIAREREMGTFEQLLVSPYIPIEILIGKAIPAMMLATCSATIVVFVVIFGFGISLKGSFLLLYFTLEVYLLAVVGVGLFISSLSMTQQQAILGCFLVMPPAIMLSGFATPVENMPVWLQWATLINPIRWYLVIIKGLFLRGMETRIVFACLVPIFLCGLFTMSCAVAMFKRRME